MLRQQWPAVIARLRAVGRQVLAANLEVATPSGYDGETVDLVFPADRTFGVAKVQDRVDDLRDALRDVFGIHPQVRCSVRSASGAVPDHEEDDPPPSDAEALARLAAELNARPATGDA